MNEFIEQFIIESREHVEQATSALLVLETTPGDGVALDALFRSLHTLKGSAGIVDFAAMERLLHDLESALSQLRASKASVPIELNDDCVAALDQVVRWLDEMTRTGEVPASAETQVANIGTGAQDLARADAGTLPRNAQAVVAAQVELLDNLARLDNLAAGHVASAGKSASNVFAWCGRHAEAELIAAATARSLAGNTITPLRDQLDQLLRSKKPETIATARATTARADAYTRTLRIDAARVEQLVRLIGELTVVKNAYGHLANLAQAEANSLAGRLKDQHAALDRITSEVQGTVLGMRVLPLRAVLGRFPPVVREMAASLGKPAKLVMEGDNTEADKTIIEMLFEPLLHVLRNAMDHGIETPALRAQRNKPALATLAIHAYRQGDRVMIEVSDDGQGIDARRIGQLAVERGLISAERLQEASETEIIDLVFSSGFSTAAQVTELSGRGVGMDAVRTAVGRVGGTVSIDSRRGLGTTVRISLPFSVMMTHVMTVEAGGQTFGIPIDAVVETIRVPLAALTGVGAAHAIAHRERTLPVFELATLLQTNTQQAPRISPERDAIVVVTACAGQWGGVRVDRLGERMEVMLKPLEGLLTGTPGITGTTIMGDGRVLLVLDMAEILA